MYVWSAVCPSEREQNPRRSLRGLTGKTRRGAEDYRLEDGIPHVRSTNQRRARNEAGHSATTGAGAQVRGWKAAN